MNDESYAQALVLMHCSGFNVSAEVKAWAFDGWVDQATRAHRQYLLRGIL